MKEKILALLTASNGQYNLPKDVLDRIANNAPEFEKEEEYSAWIESIKPFMALMQSYSDSRVTNLMKENESLKSQIGGNKGKTEDNDLESKLDKLLEEKLSKTLDEKMAGYKELSAKYEELQKKQEEQVKQSQAANFKQTVERIAKEVGLDSELLNLVSGGISEESDEKSINEYLSKCKKTFINKGIQELEGIQTTDEAAAKKRANDWVQSQVESHK